MKQGSGIDWISFDAAEECGMLLEYLLQLSREYWTERDEYGSTFLHLISRKADVRTAKALVQSNLLDVDARNKWGRTPMHQAAIWNNTHMMEVLCAAGADMRALDNDEHSPIDVALGYYAKKTVRVLVANGVRLSTLHDDHRHLITPELEKCEQGVLHCRQAVVAMLRLKKAAKLWSVDRFLIREIGFAIWATRCNIIWQN